MPQRIKRWKATGIISLRALQLCNIPEGFQQHLEALGPTTIASLYAVDVGNNSLDHLPGESDMLRCTSALTPVVANSAPVPDCSAQLGWVTQVSFVDLQMHFRACKVFNDSDAVTTGCLPRACRGPL